MTNHNHDLSSCMTNHNNDLSSCMTNHNHDLSSCMTYHNHDLSSCMTYPRIFSQSNKNCVSSGIGTTYSILSEYFSLLPVFSGVRVAQFPVVFCQLIVCLFCSLGHCIVCPSNGSL